MERSGSMASHRVRVSFGSNLSARRREERTPVILQKVVDLRRCCIGIQYFTVVRLRENGGQERMESLSELEEFIETLDLTPEEESKIARILKKLRDEATVSA